MLSCTCLQHSRFMPPKVHLPSEVGVSNLSNGGPDTTSNSIRAHTHTTGSSCSVPASVVAQRSSLDPGSVVIEVETGGVDFPVLAQNEHVDVTGFKTSQQESKMDAARAFAQGSMQAVEWSKAEQQARGSAEGCTTPCGTSSWRWHEVTVKSVVDPMTSRCSVQ